MKAKPDGEEIASMAEGLKLSVKQDQDDSEKK